MNNTNTNIPSEYWKYVYRPVFGKSKIRRLLERIFNPSRNVDKINTLRQLRKAQFNEQVRVKKAKIHSVFNECGLNPVNYLNQDELKKLNEIKNRHRNCL